MSGEEGLGTSGKIIAWSLKKLLKRADGYEALSASGKTTILSLSTDQMPNSRGGLDTSGKNHAWT